MAVYRVLVAEWIHYTFFGIELPTIKLKVYTFWGLLNSATKLNPIIPLVVILIDPFKRTP